MKKQFNNMLAKCFVVLLLATLLLSCSNSQKPKTVTIGNQEWMAENLNVDKFRNGDRILHAQTDEEWQQAGRSGQPAWCYYDNDSKNGRKYGKLYNWYAVNDPRGLATEGWRIPSNGDWDRLVDYLGGIRAAGAQMKSEIGWAQDGNGTNKSGFTALPGGRRSVNGAFIGIGNYGSWWSAPAVYTNSAWYRSVLYHVNSVDTHFRNKEAGLSVRCVRD